MKKKPGRPKKKYEVWIKDLQWGNKYIAKQDANKIMRKLGKFGTTAD